MWRFVFPFLYIAAVNAWWDEVSIGSLDFMHYKHLPVNKAHIAALTHS